MTIDHYSTAREMLAALRSKDISARELLHLHTDRITQVNPTVNALVSLDLDRAHATAAAADAQTAAGTPVGPLHGLPFAFKDTHDVAGFPTVAGSSLLVDNVPVTSELIAERVIAAGAVTIGKTNVPEFAAGSHTFNPVFGTTTNPYDPTKSAGGSSGGAAAALGAGLVPLADGSDMGGSLRNPASFCNVVGLRPTPGRVPCWPNSAPWDSLVTQGPMARNVDDLELLLSVISGPDARIRSSLSADAVAPRLGVAGLQGLRVAVSADLNGIFPVDAPVREIHDRQSSIFAAAGAVVAEDAPSIPDAEWVFRTLRAWRFKIDLGDRADATPELLKPSLLDNIRQADRLSADDVAKAMVAQAEIQQRAVEFFTHHDILVMPVSQVLPFDAELEYPAAVDGRRCDDYLDWMTSALTVTVLGCPAISVPAGFSADGLPVGVQIVAAPGNDLFLLDVARAYEQLNPVGATRPHLLQRAAASTS
ncbi:amidase family protein [Rhodococcus sp. IEGM 1307]|uniref:amidase family protein n=1 Tax=Rhodococcus sp. IEGM 1307 TaxID=3047091 RepID=UPI0024B64B04|nr:amidase family protein [Rhodococcus sp. IEGM 1307]MDI9972159.1 amidase family protein [Rhodococcus sp. IEGM 1307]